MIHTEHHQFEPPLKLLDSGVGNFGLRLSMLQHSTSTESNGDLSTSTHVTDCLVELWLNGLLFNCEWKVEPDSLSGRCIQDGVVSVVW